MAGFSITDWSATPSGFSLEGDAAVNINNGIDSNPVLRLTTAEVWKEGRILYGTKISVAKWSATIKFRLTGGGGAGAPGGSYGGDGLCMFFHNTTLPALGDTAGCFGMNEVAPSVQFEADTWANLTLSDPSSSHVGITIDGCVASIATADVAPRLNDGNLRTMNIDYDGTNAVITVDGTTEITQALDMADLMEGPEGWIGIAAATGNAYENHFIIEWTLEYEALTARSKIFTFNGGLV